MARLAKLAWAAPYSLLGLTAGAFALALGGRVQKRRGVIEFYGDGARRLLSLLPDGQFVIALTLGHTIIDPSQAALDIARDHEHVHVRQFERWGFFMGPVYLGCSLWIWLSGAGDPYRDNPFEREAYDQDRLCRGPGQ
ncbi:MAG: hypothetical protein AAF589_06760 [Planctomycetota bacterium]